MVTETVMLKIETARQAAQVAAAQGKTFVVGKAVAGNGMNNMLILNPTTAGGQTIAVQLAGNNQAATVAAMGGKTVTIGNSPLMLGGGASKWVVIKPAAGAVAKTAAVGAGGAATAKGAAAATAAKAGVAGAAAKTAAVGAGAAAAADVTITQIQGANSILIEVANAKQAAMAKAAGGKAFTVVAPPVGANANNMLFLKPAGAAAGQGGNQVMMLKVQEGANQIPALIGKTFSVNKAPTVAGVGPKNLIILKPVTVTGTKAAAATTTTAAAKTAGTKAAAGAAAKTGAAAKAAGGMAGKPVMMNAAMTAPAATAGKACVAGKGAATATSAAAAAKTTAAAGTIWSGTGWSLGLGLGLGAWGPVILGGLAAAGVYGYVRSKKDQDAHKSDSELQPAH